MTSSSIAPKTIDAQVHIWLPNDNPAYPWADDYPKGFFETRVEPHSAERVLEDMDAAGVAAAIAVVPRLYGWDNSYAIDAARRFPKRIAVVARVDWSEPGATARLARMRDTPGVVAIRLTRAPRHAWDAKGEFASILDAAATLDFPVCVMTGPSNLDMLDEVARRHPELRLVIDHLGMEAPPSTVPEPGAVPFRHLPDLLALSSHRNIHVKLTAAVALSNENYPFRDIWSPVREIVSAFGAARVMWGSDYNRVATLASYADSINYLREMGFDQDTLAHLYHGTAASTFDLKSF